MFTATTQNGHLAMRETKTTRRAYYRGQLAATQNLRTGAVTFTETASAHTRRRILDTWNAY
jgi:hypothetical protein